MWLNCINVKLLATKNQLMNFKKQDNVGLWRILRQTLLYQTEDKVIIHKLNLQLCLKILCSKPNKLLKRTSSHKLNNLNKFVICGSAWLNKMQILKLYLTFVQ